MIYQPYIAAIDLRGAHVLVIGGGVVAERKVASLIDAGADVKVIAPHISSQLEAYRREGSIEWTPRSFRWHDLDTPALLTFAATDKPGVNREIVERARLRGKLVNGADKSAGRNFSTPASFKHDGLTFSVSSGGGDLARSILWRDRLQSELGSQRSGDREEGGRVTLVGAGPGAADTLTLGGRRAIVQADVIVYDNLVSEEVLGYASPQAERIYVGKLPFSSTTSQEDINRLLVAKALAGKSVVRLKGGDPFIFGRGAEELEVLHRAGVPFEVIAGVSSLNGALAAAGVSITKRYRNIGFSAFAATPRTSIEEIREWARTPGPVAVFMGVHAAALLSQSFIEIGRSPDEEVTIVARGGHDDQRVVVTSLAELPEVFDDPSQWTPALIVIGVVPEPGFSGVEYFKGVQLSPTQMVDADERGYALRV